MTTAIAYAGLKGRKPQPRLRAAADGEHGEVDEATVALPRLPAHVVSLLLATLSQAR